MMQASPLSSAVLFHIGPIPIARPVVTTWAIMLALAAGSRIATRHLALHPGLRQAAVESLIETLTSEIKSVVRREPGPFLALLGTLFIFLAVSNLSGVLPGVQAPTGRIETPAALAAIVFMSVHYFGVRSQGVRRYLAGFAKPKIIMLPLNVVSEITRTFSLMVRLFGNVMSGEFVLALVVTLAGLFVPIPFMVLEILVGLIQAYIFTVLATVFIGAALGGEPG